MENKLKAGDVIEFNGKKYRAESEVEKGTCIGCDLFNAGESTCGYGVPRCIHFIFKEVKDAPRHIELGVVKVEGDKVTFKIIEQTHKGKEFCQQTHSNTFQAPNGVVLKSIGPSRMAGNLKLFCRGVICEKDDVGITCTAIKYAQISEAITEYNATNGKGYEKPWPQTGDRYFYITSDCIVGDCIFYDMALGDNERLACGNCFRTEDEAKAAADKVRALLKELAAK